MHNVDRDGNRFQYIPTYNVDKFLTYNCTSLNCGYQAFSQLTSMKYKYVISR